MEKPFENFTVLGDIVDVETIAVGSSIRELAWLERNFGR